MNTFLKFVSQQWISVESLSNIIKGNDLQSIPSKRAFILLRIKMEIKTKF